MGKGLGYKVRVSLEGLWWGQLIDDMIYAEGTNTLEDVEKQMSYYKELITTAWKLERACRGYNVGLRTAEELIHTVVPWLAEAVADLASDRVHDADIIADLTTHNAALERRLEDAEGYIDFLTNEGEDPSEVLPNPTRSYNEMVEWIESSTIESLMQAFELGAGHE